MTTRLARITVTSKRQITLPAEVCRALGIEQGDQLEVQCREGEIRLRPVPQYAPLTRRSCLFRFLGIGSSKGGHGARDHDVLIAQEAAERHADA